MPLRAPAQGKQAAAGDVGKPGGASVQAPAQKDASPASGSSAFNQLIEQFVTESAAPETAPTPAGQTLKLPPKPPAASSTSTDALPPLPATVQPAPARLAAAPVGGRRADTRATATPNAQPPAAVVDLNVPIPVAPKLPLPSYAGGISSEQKPATAAVSNAEEPPAITLEPKPILEVKIRLNQPVTGTSSVQQPTLPVAQSTVAPVASTPGQQNPQRGEDDPGDGDAGPATQVNVHMVPRTAGNQSAAAIVQPQRPDVGSPPPAHDSVAVPLGALPAPAAPAPVIARGATPEPAAGSAAPAEESPINQPKTQQPLRSLALEFAPDGAGDIKVRLSERAGDVHISLHGTDPSLAGRVREGVGELVGSLSKAGYDAETWTPGQGRQNQRQQPDQRQPAADSGGADADAEDFSGIFQQPIQEIS